MRTCQKCGCLLEGAHGRRKYCPTCAQEVMREQMRQWRESRRPERYCQRCGAPLLKGISGDRRYKYCSDECAKEAQREMIRENSYRRYWDNHEQEKERSRQYYAEHKAEKLAAFAKWREEHLEESRAIQRRWYAEHREELVEKARRYRADLGDDYRAYMRERYHRLKKLKNRLVKAQNPDAGIKGKDKSVR